MHIYVNHGFYVLLFCEFHSILRIFVRISCVYRSPVFHFGSVFCIIYFISVVSEVHVDDMHT